MKEVEYRGKPTSFARLGDLKKGDRKTITSGDWDWLKNDKRFKLLTPEYSEGEIEAASRIKPWGHAFFDLRAVPWENPNLFNQLQARTTKPKLMLMLNAIEAIGGVLPAAYDRNSEREQLVDAVVEASRIMQWDKYSRDERLSLPLYAALGDEEAEKEGEPAEPIQTPENAEEGEEQVDTSEPPVKAIRKRTRKPATA